MKKPFNPEKCRWCEKIAFNCEHDAYEYANWLESTYGYYIRVYWSGSCGCYHFTSK